MPLTNYPNCFPEINTEKKVNWQLSEKIRKLVKAEDGMCALNVSRAFIDHREDLPEDAVYVEGIWMVGGQPDLHAWIEDDDQIIDPTYVFIERYLRDEGVKHCPIFRLSWGEAHEHYRNQIVEPGKKLALMLTWDNPKVKKVLHNVNPP